MRLGGDARYLALISSVEALEEALEWAAIKKVPTLMISGGANIIFRDEGFDGLVLVNDIEGISITQKGDAWLLTAFAGEVWDDVVAFAVEQGLSGIECLSLIPGKTGAAAVQNIGAYGQELSQTLLSLEAYDTQTKDFVTLPADECHFSYRSSRFNRQDKGRFYIISLTMRLSRTALQPPFYKDIEKYFLDNPAETITPGLVREAVIAIRNRKLPDPAEHANSGSFFYNPIIPRAQYEALIASHPELDEPPPGWSQPPRWFLDDGTVKLSAARLIELSGYKAAHDHETGMALWPSQNLVFINEHAGKTADLLKFREKIVTAVRDRFGIELQQEPELI